MPSNSLGWGLREAQALQAVLQDCGHQLLLLPLSQHASYAVMCSGDKCLCSIHRANWEAVRSPLPFLSGWTHLFAPLARHWKCGGDSLPAAPLLLPLHVLPELQRVRRIVPPKPWFGNGSSTNTLLCALLSILARSRKLSPCWTGSLSSCCSDLYAVAKLLYGTFVKHALTVCKCMAFKQQSLYYQMQSCRLCSSGWKALGGEAGCDSEIWEPKQKEILAHVLGWSRFRKGGGWGSIYPFLDWKCWREIERRGEAGQGQGNKRSGWLVAHSLLCFVCCL